MLCGPAGGNMGTSQARRQEILAVTCGVIGVSWMVLPMKQAVEPSTLIDHHRHEGHTACQHYNTILTIWQARCERLSIVGMPSSSAHAPCTFCSPHPACAGLATGASSSCAAAGGPHTQFPQRHLRCQLPVSLSSFSRLDLLSLRADKWVFWRAEAAGSEAPEASDGNVNSDGS